MNPKTHDRATAAIQTGLVAAAGLGMTKPADVALCILSAFEQEGLRIIAQPTDSPLPTDHAPTTYDRKTRRIQTQTLRRRTR